MNTRRVPVAFIGLGQMGRPMASNLLKHGYPVFGYDAQPLALAQLRGGSVRICPSAAEACAAAEVVVLSLPTESVLEQVLLGPERIPGDALRGKVVVDTTTTTVRMAEMVAAALAHHDCSFLDAPLTGGVSGAESGTLTIMVGGSADTFNRCLPLFRALGSKIVHVGPNGHGQAAKMVNQMLMGAIYTSIAEAFAFATQMEVDVSKVYDAVEEGGAQSKMLSMVKASLLAGTIRKNGNVDQHGKDIDYVMSEANRRRIPLPITSSVHDFYKLARTLGFGEIWSGEMWAVWEKLLGIDHTATIRNGAARFDA